MKMKEEEKEEQEEEEKKKSKKSLCSLELCFYTLFSQTGFFSPSGNFCRSPRGKPAVTESRYLTLSLRPISAITSHFQAFRLEKRLPGWEISHGNRRGMHFAKYFRGSLEFSSFLPGQQF